MKKNQMKKILLAVAMVVVVAAGLLVYSSGKTASKGTTSMGTAKGFGGDVTVTLTLADGKIIGCTAEGKDETEGVGSTAIDQLPGAIAESGSIAVDGVAGATVTSNAIKEAAAAALTAAGLNPDDYKTAVDNTAEPAEDSTVDADVVIVGAGGAGMTAAITAANEGKSVVILESQAMVGGNSIRATGGMNAGKTVYQDENEFGESAGVEKTLKTAAEKYADNETITALAATVAEQWAAYQARPHRLLRLCGADGAGYHDRRQGHQRSRSGGDSAARTAPMPSTGWTSTASPCTAFPALAALLSSASIAL